jgi:hypothetical protein
MTRRVVSFVNGRRISHRGCVGIIDAAASLSLTGGVAWTVDESSVGHSPRDLAPSLVELRRSGSVFTLPVDAGRWFSLSFAVADARYALGFQFVWGLSALSHDGRPLAAEVNAVDVVMWWLRGTMPADCATDLRRARRALSAAYQRV